MTANPMIVIGENIHATRVLMSPEKKGKKVVAAADGSLSIPFTGVDGSERALSIPESYKETSVYQSGKVKHMGVAMSKVMEAASSEEVEEGKAYLHYGARRQIEHGAAFLDVNVDETSPEPEVRMQAMRVVVEVLQEEFDTPLSVDSSHPGVLRAGLEAYDTARGGQALINSVSLERPDVLDLVVEFKTAAVVSAAGEKEMPEDDAQRVANAKAMADRLLQAGCELAHLHIDPLVFPVGANSQAVVCFLEASKRLREMYGPELHLTGGFSNVSFGMPNRKLLNQVFLKLAMDAGCDSGIIDPVVLKPARCAAIDTDVESYKVAAEALLGRDDFCANYVSAHREGVLKAFS